jgi:thioredoxin-related protein
MKRIAVIIFILSAFTAFAQEDGIRFEHDLSWQQVLDKAKKENKFILLDAYTSWCGPCKWMTKEIFPKPEVGAAVNPHYISAKFDMEKGEGIELQKKYEVRNFPTYLFFDPAGNLVHRSIGSMPAKDFIQVCSDALDSTKQYVTLRKKYLKGQQDSLFLREFAYVAESAQDSLSKIAMLKYFKANNYQLNSNTIQFLFGLTSSLRDTSFNILLNNKEEFYKVIGKDKVDATIEELVWNEAKKAGKKGTDTAGFRKVIQQYIPEKTAMLNAEYQLSLLVRSNNWKAYRPKAEAFADKFCRDDYDRLNYIAGNFYENYKDRPTMELALKMALRSVELNSNYDNNSTVAHLYERLNNKEKAKEYAKISLDQAKKEDAETFEIEQFLKSLNK